MASAVGGELGGDVDLRDVDLDAIARRLAAEREPRARFLDSIERAHGFRFGPELAAWIRAFETYELEVADPSGAELRLPSAEPSLRELVEQPSPTSWLADLVGFLSASSVIVERDELSFLASWAPAPDGASRVHSFHLGDFGLWPAERSIARLLRRLLENDREHFVHLRFRDEAMATRATTGATSVDDFPPHLDPSRLFPRIAWMIRLFFDVEVNWKAALEKVATKADFEAEKDLLADWPHLAMHWLWFHWAFGNRAELDVTFALTDSVENLVVVESREIVRALVARRKVSLGVRDRTAFERFRETLTSSSKARLERDRRSPNRVAETDEERRARADLEIASALEPLVREALALLDALSMVGSAPGNAARFPSGLDEDGAALRLSEIIDRRFAPIVRARLRRDAQVSDARATESRGLLLSLAALASSFDEFRAEVERLGTEQFGARRFRDLYRAYATFEDPRATAALAAGARAWLGQADDWIRTVSDEPVLRLLARDTLDTHEWVATVLERLSFSAANWGVCVAAAEAAGRLESKRAIVGLRRAARERLGRIEDESRVRVLSALVAVEGASCLEFVRALHRDAIDAWKRSEPEDARMARNEAAQFLVPLLRLDPREPEIVECARSMLGELQNDLEAGRPSRATVATAIAILRAVHASEARALVDAVAPYRSLRFRETESTRGTRELARALAETICREIGVISPSDPRSGP